MGNPLDLGCSMLQDCSRGGFSTHLDHTGLISELYRASGASALGLAEPDFARVFEEIAAKYLGADATGADRQRLWASLHLRELALARACAAGSEIAWEEFIRTFRPKMHLAARGIAKDELRAQELADSLWADLYGTAGAGGDRRSKLSLYSGRGSLEGWLRTVLAQAHIDSLRRGKRLVSLEAEEEQGRAFRAPEPEPAPATNPNSLARATDHVLASLAADERLLLTAYFLDGRTMAEVGRLLGCHESTVSRKLEKLLATLRGRIHQALVESGLSPRQANEALEADVRDLEVNVRARLAQETAARAFLPGSAEGRKN